MQVKVSKTRELDGVMVDVLETLTRAKRVLCASCETLDLASRDFGHGVEKFEQTLNQARRFLVDADKELHDCADMAAGLKEVRETLLAQQDLAPPDQKDGEQDD